MKIIQTERLQTALRCYGIRYQYDDGSWSPWFMATDGRTE